ncbi:MAG: ATP-binding protein [Patescibacteria group bacterium]|nr:ATP-binding protein [Nitrososphaerota archaeon]MDE2590812.1 ATP-binding protein [Patescibacteria group bacterium]
MKEKSLDVAGQIVGGQVAKILVRQKSGKKLEIGDILVSEEDGSYLILQVYNLLYGSQIPKTTHELLAGLRLEGFGTDLEFMEPKLRNYVLAEVKAIANVSNNGTEIQVKIPKILPSFFQTIRPIQKDDLTFLTQPTNPVYIGKVRSGSKIIDVDVFLPSSEIFPHHILIPATTGRGKSNLVRIMLWSLLNLESTGALVLDPHNEYYETNGKGLKSHPNANKRLAYYTPNPKNGAKSLVINLRSIKPDHFMGIVNFTDAQWDAIRLYHSQFGENWLEEIVLQTPIQGSTVPLRTFGVLRRKFYLALGIEERNGEIHCRNNTFSGGSKGESTIDDIVKFLEEGKVVIADTSRLSDAAELIIGSIVAGTILEKYQYYKTTGELESMPVITIIVEEAPRVLGIDVLEEGDNIYSTIAREGRKFKIGLTAITQVVSLIPKTILANMNTKIILGNEMSTERSAIISSASQDLSEDDRTIASLDKGEAIISSIFTKFAIPIQVPMFEDFIKDKSVDEKKSKKIVIG